MEQQFQLSIALQQTVVLHLFLYILTLLYTLTRWNMPYILPFDVANANTAASVSGPWRLELGLWSWSRTARRLHLLILIFSCTWHVVTECSYCSFLFSVMLWFLDWFSFMKHLLLSAFHRPRKTETRRNVGETRRCQQDQ